MDEQPAGQASTFKQIVAYVDQLHEDIGKMAILIEQLMEEEGFTSELGSRGSWALTNSYNQPTRWRLPYLYRLFVPADMQTTTSSLFYLVQLETKSVFDFPTIVCGQITHPALPTEDFRGQTARAFKNNLLLLTSSQPRWQQLRQKNGWSIAEDPEFETSLQKVQGFILNLFDMVDRQLVIDNISRPLANLDKNLDEMVTVGKYPFGGSV